MRDGRGGPHFAHVGNTDVPVDVGGAPHHAVTAYFGGSRDTRAGGHHSVLPDSIVVPQLNLVVELRALAHHRIFNRTAVDRRVGADFHIICDRNAPHLRNLHPLACKRCKPETVRPDHAARMQNHAAADRATVVNDGIGVQNRIVAHRRTGSDVGTGEKPGTRPDDGTAPHKSAGFDNSRRINGSPLFDGCLRINASGGFLPGRKDLQRPSKPCVGVCGHDERAIRRCPFGPHRFHVFLRQNQDPRL